MLSTLTPCWLPFVTLRSELKVTCFIVSTVLIIVWICCLVICWLLAHFSECIFQKGSTCIFPISYHISSAFVEWMIELEVQCSNSVGWNLMEMHGSPQSKVTSTLFPLHLYGVSLLLFPKKTHFWGEEYKSSKNWSSFEPSWSLPAARVKASGGHIAFQRLLFFLKVGGKCQLFSQVWFHRASRSSHS